MKRLVLLGGGLVLTGLLAQAANVRPKIPAWAEREISTAVKRFEDWKGKDEVVTFVYMNDVHSYVAGISDPPNYKDPKMHIPLALECADRVNADFFADLGDQDLEWAARHGGVRGLDARIRELTTLFSPGLAKRPILFCVGNHEHCYGVPTVPGKIPVSNEAFGEMSNALSVKAGHKVTLGENKSWGYYDVPGKKLRAFFLNSSDDDYYSFSKAQLEFVAKGLMSLEPGWQALMMVHYCIDETVGSVHGCRHCTCKRAPILIRMVEDFVWRAKGAEEGVSWDFTKSDGLFVGFFCGDAHCSNQGERNFIHYTLSQGYGYSTVVPYGATSFNFSRAENCLFEIVALKPAKAEAHVFRVGIGGAAADRQYTYDRKRIEKCSRW